MKYKEYINELAIEYNPELNRLFLTALKQVFAPSFLNKIERVVVNNIKIKEVDERKGIVAYNIGDTIYINKNEFFDRDKTSQVRYVLHEFVHVLQRKKGIFFKKFKELTKLTDNINSILKKHLKQPLSVFLTGKNQKIGAGGKWEILAYFMNNSINWSAISDEGKAKIIQEIEASGIFNTSHPFWKKRLN